MTCDHFEGALRSVGRTFAEFERIYDFGCGCGRLTRWAAEAAPRADLWASDIDEQAILWMRQNLSEINSFRNEWLPPLPLRESFFDLVLAWSVFTHLPPDFQDAWLLELRRVTAPAALLLISVHGELNWQWMKEQPSGPAVSTEVEGTLHEHGFAHYRADGWAEHFPDFYHTSWHLPLYIRSHWSQWFDVVAILEGAGFPGPGAHDIVVLWRPDDDSVEAEVSPLVTPER